MQLNQMQNKNNLLLFTKLILSCLFCGIAVSCIAVPNGLAITGTTGLAMAMSRFIPLDYALIYYLITMAVSVLAWFTLGFKEVLKILFLAIVYPLTMYFTRFLPLHIVFEDKLLAVLLFSILYGLGFGLSYSSNFSYGGSDTVGKILKATLLKRLPLDQVLNIVECVIVLILLTIYDFELVLYALVAEVIYVQITNYLTSGTADKKVVMVQITLAKGVEKGSESVQSLIDTVMKKKQAHLVITEENQIQMEYISTEQEVKKNTAFLSECRQGYEMVVLPVLHNYRSEAL